MCFFVIDDPFGIFYKNNCLAERSEDVVKIREYYSEENYPSSFIFGNSRAHAFTNSDWQKHIDAGTVFNFSSPGESVLNIKKKMQLILEHGKIKNALILIDEGILENTDNKHRFYKGPVYEHSPLTSNNSYLSFYSNYIKYYFQDFFYLKHIYYKITGRYLAGWMGNSFKDPNTTANIISSTRYATLADSLIENNFNKYKIVFKPDYSSFPRKLQKVSTEDSIHLAQIKMLLEDNNVNYKLVFPPDFSGTKIKPGIYKTIYTIFGNKFYDITGVNKISTDSTLNYENLHFTSRAGAMMLDSLYKD